MNFRKFYDEHLNFSMRTISEYFISPGIKTKFDTIRENLKLKKIFKNGIDIGCSGNSILQFLDDVIHKSFFDISVLPLHQYRKDKFKILVDKNKDFFKHPIQGDIQHLPFRSNNFDFISALDVLEHIKNDKLAISEIKMEDLLVSKVKIFQKMVGIIIIKQ